MKAVFALAVLGVLGMLLATAALGTSSAPVTLSGAVGPGFTIKLTKDGKIVKRLKAGTYRFVISDRSASHNFELEKEPGGKPSRSLTSVGFKGIRSVTVKLTNGRWKFYCEPHNTVMRGFFTVGLGNPAATTSGTTTDDHGGSSTTTDDGTTTDDRGGYGLSHGSDG
jgi:hypothetical protein